MIKLSLSNYYCIQIWIWKIFSCDAKCSKEHIYQIRIQNETKQLVYSHNENTHNGKFFTTTKVLHFWLRLMPHMSCILTFPEVIIEVMPVIIGPDICCDVVSLCIWTLHIYNLQIAAGHRFMESHTVFGFVVWAFFDLIDGQCNQANACKPADLDPARIFYAGRQSSSCAVFTLIHSALFWKSCFPSDWSDH